MARANLVVNRELQDSFVSAQEDTSVVRALKVRISDEELVLASVVDANGPAEEDFNTVLVNLLGASEASMVLFCTSELASRGKKWVLVSWIPDGCRVRDKMLYASSREDLKRTLGIGYFSSDFAANLITDVTWDAYQTFLQKDLNKEHLMTDSERLMKEENELARVESVSTKSTAMGVIPFGLGTGVVDALKAFVSGSSNWVELSVAGEVIMLESMKSVASGENLQPFIDETQARFILLKLPNQSRDLTSFFIFSCPESISIKIKMTMSTSKATVIATAAEHGILFNKTIEIRGADEIMEQVNNTLGISEGSNSSSASSAAASQQHAKPSRPGRGKAKVSKFQDLEESV